MNVFATVMILFSSFAIAFFIIKKEIKHCAVLEESIKLINLIKNRAMFYSEPLPDIVDGISANDNKYLKEFRYCFSENKDLPADIPERWKTAVELCFGQYLEAYECDILIHFGEELCACSRSEIEKIYDNAEQALYEFINTARQKRNTNAKSTAAISVSVGVMIVLMLI